MFAESSPGYVHTSMVNAATNLLSALQPTVPPQLQQQATHFSQLRLPSPPFSVSEREEMDFWASYYSHHQVMAPPSQQLFRNMTSVTEEEEIFSDAELMSVLGGFVYTD